MKIKTADRMKRLPPYIFAELESLINEKRRQGVDLISLSIGDPDLPPPKFILEALAKESSNPTAIAVARSVGHAVATAHAADHSLGAALYALKAVKSAGKSIEAERDWQDKQLPIEIKDLILTAKKSRKYRSFFYIQNKNI